MKIYTWYRIPNYYMANYNGNTKHFAVDISGRDDALHLAKLWLLINKLGVI